MKSNKFYYSLLALGMMTLASCGTDELEAFDSTTEPVPASCAAVEFASSNKTVFELLVLFFPILFHNSFGYFLIMYNYITYHYFFQ